MENKTSFDLSLAIERWRDNLGQSPALCSENLDELQSHLRDSIVRLQTRGLSAEEAFFVAVKRMGQSGSLETEFAKVNGRAVWMDRILWMLIGIQTWQIITRPAIVIVRSALRFGLNGAGYDALRHSSVLLTTLFTLAELMGLGGSLALCWWLIWRRGQTLSARVRELIGRPGLAVLSCFGLWVLALAAQMSGYLGFIIEMRLVNTHTISPQLFMAINTSESHSLLAFAIVEAAVLVGLTIVFARNRLRMCSA